jgi:hypothetical protein
MSLPVSIDELHAMVSEAYPEAEITLARIENRTRHENEAGAREAIAALGTVGGWIACAHATWPLNGEVPSPLDDYILLGAELVTTTGSKRSLSVRSAGADTFLVSSFEETDGTPSHLRETIALMGEPPVSKLVYARYWSTTPEGLTHPVAACLWQIYFRADGRYET